MGEGNDDRFRPIGRVRETLRQWLARKVTEGTRIDTTAGMEYTKWVELEGFLGNIFPFAGDKEEGTEEARKYTDGPDELSF